MKQSKKISELTAPAAAVTSSSCNAGAASVLLPATPEPPVIAAKKAAGVGSRHKDSREDVSIAPGPYQNIPSLPHIQAQSLRTFDI